MIGNICRSEFLRHLHRAFVDCRRVVWALKFRFRRFGHGNRNQLTGLAALFSNAAADDASPAFSRLPDIGQIGRRGAKPLSLRQGREGRNTGDVRLMGFSQDGWRRKRERIHKNNHGDELASKA